MLTNEEIEALAEKLILNANAEMPARTAYVEAAAALRQLAQERACILSALGEHPDTEMDIAERIGQIRDEGRAHFHNYTKLLMERDRKNKLLRTGYACWWNPDELRGCVQRLLAECDGET